MFCVKVPHMNYISLDVNTNSMLAQIYATLGICSLHIILVFLFQIIIEIEISAWGPQPGRQRRERRPLPLQCRGHAKNNVQVFCAVIWTEDKCIVCRF